MAPYAKASYNLEKEEWGWEKINTLEEELAKAPRLAGLVATIEEGKIIYQAESDNPYGLEAGEYAGYLFDFDDETGVSCGKGIALAAEVRKKLLEEVNTPEEIEKGNWKTTFNFDPKGERIRVKKWEPLAYSLLAIDGNFAGTKFVSPFTEEVLAKLYFHSNIGSWTVGIFMPENLLNSSQHNINYALSFQFKSAENITIDNAGRRVNFNEPIFESVGEYLPSPAYPGGKFIWPG